MTALKNRIKICRVKSYNSAWTLADKDKLTKDQWLYIRDQDHLSELNFHNYSGPIIWVFANISISFKDLEERGL